LNIYTLGGHSYLFGQLVLMKSTDIDDLLNLFRNLLNYHKISYLESI